MGLYRLFQFFIVLFFCASLNAASPNNIDVIDGSEARLIGKQTAFFEDVTGEMILEEIMLEDHKGNFKLQEKDVFSRPATRSAFWYKIILHNHSSEDLWLEIASTYAWYIDFYALDSAGQYLKVIETGTMRPDSNKIHDVNLFWLPLNNAYDTIPRTYFVRIQSGMTYELPMYLGSLKALAKNKDRNDYLTAGFMGIILIMFLYNLFIYFSTKDKIYIFYLGYLFLMGISMPYANSYPFILELDFGFLNKETLNNYFLFWHTPVYFFIGEFCIRFLNLKQNGPIIRKVIYGQLIILSLLIPLLTLIGVAFVDLVNITQLLIVIFYLTCLLTGYYFAIKRVQSAVFYVLGWTFMVAGALIFFAVVNGFLPFNSITRNSLYFGVALEVWMFSLALGHRMHKLQQEKERIQKENFELIANQNQLLEQKVKERTEELLAMNDDLSTSNEELHMLTEKLDVQSQELQELNSAKDQVFAILSHDLRSPLIVLQSLLFLVSDDSLDADKFRERILKVQGDVEHLHVSLNNILQWAINQMEGIIIMPKQVNLFANTKDVLSLLNSFVNTKAIRVTNNIDKNTLVNADADIYNLVLRNLVYNAIKFTPDNGQITISSNIDGDFCVVSVKDTGVGIAEDKLDKLFSPINIESSDGTKGEKGTGLGLVLCKEFAKKNGGDIWVESTINKGSTFYFSLKV